MLFYGLYGANKDNIVITAYMRKVEMYIKVLMVTSQMDEGGAETHIHSLAAALVRRGCGVTVASAGGRAAQLLGRDGVAHVTLPLNKKNPISLIRCYLGLRRTVRNGGFKVIHAHSRIAALVSSWVCRGKRGESVCLVTTVHARFKESAILDRLSRWGRAAIAVSDDLRVYLLTHSEDILAQNVCVIPNGIDTQRFSPREKCHEGKLRIVFVSRLDSDCSSAAYALCRIAPRLCQRYDNIEITIGGGGDQYENIKALAEDINSEVGGSVIKAVGRVEDVPDLDGNADVFVGVSRAALEAMSCATPVILAGNEGFLGVAEGAVLNRAEQTNFCCRDCGDINDELLFCAVCDLLDRGAEQRRRLGMKLREYVISYHSVDAMAKKTAAFYRASVGRVHCGKGGVRLCGYYGFGNMGDDLLLDAAIKRAASRFPHMPVTALSAKGKRDGRKYGVRCVCRSYPLGVMREIRRADVVVFGGGTLLQNSTSRRSLWYYLFILRYAERCGKRTELWGNGIGEIFGTLARRVTAVALSECSYVGMRERESAAYVRELVAEQGLLLPPVRLERDLVMEHTAVGGGRGEYILDRLGVREGTRTAVIALRGIEKRGYMASLESFIGSLISDNIKPIFVAMYPYEDMETCRRICRKLGGVLAYPVSAADVAALMKRSCMVCGMRYHALVLAHLSGVPFIGFGGESKIRSFCRSHGGVYYTELEDIL